MKKQLFTIVLLAVLSLSVPVKAQNVDHPWLVGFGMNFVDFTSADPMFDGLYDFSDFKGVIALSRFNVARNLNNSFALDLSGSLGAFSRSPLSGARQFVDVDLSLKYLLANGYILKTTSCFDPYLLIGPGISAYNSTSSFALNAGVGLNIWLSDGFAITAQTVLNKVSEDAIGDYFHHSIGFSIRFGQGKDADHDGVPDKTDKCPTVPGLESLMGCPDKDGDGIADADDACPDVKGSMQLKGCPDTDGDGIADGDDACPTEAGTVATKGCPDKDGDGIADKDDACPDAKGLVEYKGCPDTDGDGISDNEDACPNDKGTSATKGCPDRDGDGIADKDDKCPDVKGIAANNGCPAMEEEKKKEVLQKISFAAKAIQFETGKDVIKPVSFSKLDTVVSIMKTYPYTKWAVEGHTDNVGKTDKNLDLSKRRAAAVRNYFISKGVDASRLSSEGYGDTKPAADNKTAAGRATNRRVEIKLVD